jgi:HEAT repeat protein
VISAAAKFAEEGAVGLVFHFARHPDPAVRGKMAERLRFDSSDFKEKKDLALALASDQDPQVRAKGVGLLHEFREPAIIQRVLGQLDQDQQPDVQKECVSFLALVHHNGYGPQAVEAFTRHLQNPSPIVRKEIANAIGWLPEQAIQQVGFIADKLLQDPEESVRESMAFQFRNMSDFKPLIELAVRTAQNDPAEGVRAEALAGLGTLAADPSQVVSFYQQHLGREQSEKILWGMLGGLRDHKEHPQARAMLQQLAQSPYSGLASSARDALEG